VPSIGFTGDTRSVAAGDSPNERLDPHEIELVLSGNVDGHVTIEETGYETIDTEDRVPLGQKAGPWIRTHQLQSAFIAVVVAAFSVAALYLAWRPKPIPPQPTTIAVEPTGTPGNGATIEFRTVSVELNLHDTNPNGQGYTFVTISGPRILKGRSTIDYVAPGQTVGGVLYADLDCAQPDNRAADYRIILEPGIVLDSIHDSATATAIGLGPLDSSWRSLVTRACDRIKNNA
jgi:hypothetical protein